MGTIRIFHTWMIDRFLAWRRLGSSAVVLALAFSPVPALANDSDVLCGLLEQPRVAPQAAVVEDVQVLLPRRAEPPVTREAVPMAVSRNVDAPPPVVSTRAREVPRQAVSRATESRTAITRLSTLQTTPTPTAIASDKASRTRHVERFVSSEQGKRFVSENAVFEPKFQGKSLDQLNDDYAVYWNSTDGRNLTGLEFNVENSIAKELNDTLLIDKELVDATENLYKKVIYEQIMKNPALKENLVHLGGAEFKSLKLVFKNSREDLRPHLEVAFKSANTEFAKILKSQSPDFQALFEEGALVRGIAKDPRYWHTAGIGERLGTGQGRVVSNHVMADRAALASRQARDQNRLRYHVNQRSESTEPVGIMLDWAHATGEISQRTKVISNLRVGFSTSRFSEVWLKRGIFQRAPKGPGYILGRDMIDLLRRFKHNRESGLSYHDALRKEIDLRFPARFESSFNVPRMTDKEIEDLRDYHNLVDSMMANLPPTPKASLNYKGNEGLLSIDFEGAGRDNFHLTQVELSAFEGAPDPNQAVRIADLILESMRKAEQLATDQLMQRAAQVSTSLGSSVRNIQRTGDDFLARLPAQTSQQQIEAVLTQLSLLPSAGRNRVTFIRPTYANGSEVPESIRSTLNTEAQNLQKAIVDQLRKQGVKTENLDSVFLSVQVTPLREGTGILDEGQSNILVGGQDLSSSMIEKIKTAVKALMTDGGKGPEIKILRAGGAGG